jgi:hypothetical protein
LNQPRRMTSLLQLFVQNVVFVGESQNQRNNSLSCSSGASPDFQRRFVLAFVGIRRVARTTEAVQVGELAAMISDEYQSQPDYAGCIIYPSSLVLCPNSS